MTFPFPPSYLLLIKSGHRCFIFFLPTFLFFFLVFFSLKVLPSQTIFASVPLSFRSFSSPFFEPHTRIDPCGLVQPFPLVGFPLLPRFYSQTPRPSPLFAQSEVPPEAFDHFSLDLARLFSSSAARPRVLPEAGFSPRSSPQFFLQTKSGRKSPQFSSKDARSRRNLMCHLSFCSTVSVGPVRVLFSFSSEEA